MYTQIYITESLCCTAEINTLLINYTSIKEKKRKKEKVSFYIADSSPQPRPRRIWGSTPPNRRPSGRPLLQRSD